jgi:hypothetical protein
VGLDGDSAVAKPTEEERAAAASVLRMIWGIHISRAVYVAAALGIADLLAGGPMTDVDLANATRAHRPSLYRVLRVLAALGLFSEGPGRSFSLTVLGDRLRTDVPASMRSWAMLVESTGGVRAFEPMLETVRTGTAGLDIAHGMPLFEFLSQHPELEDAFDAAMSERTTAFAPSVAGGYDFSSLGTVVDVGGGKGTLLAAVLGAHSHLRGVLFERPTVTADAHERLSAAGVSDRSDVVTGDFFDTVPKGADAYFLANVLHDWDDARAVDILRNCRDAMADGGRVLIIERLIADNPADAVPVLLSDLNMLVVTGGLERTNAEYGHLLTDAGLIVHGIHAVAAPYGIIEGIAP